MELPDVGVRGGSHAVLHFGVFHSYMVDINVSSWSMAQKLWIPFWKRLKRTIFGYAAPKKIGLYKSSNDKKTLSVVDQVKKYFPMYSMASPLQLKQTLLSLNPAHPQQPLDHLYPPAFTGVTYRKKSFSLKIR